MCNRMPSCRVMSFRVMDRQQTRPCVLWQLYPGHRLSWSSFLAISGTLPRTCQEHYALGLSERIKKASVQEHMQRAFIFLGFSHILFSGCKCFCGSVVLILRQYRMTERFILKVVSYLECVFAYIPCSPFGTIRIFTKKKERSDCCECVHKVQMYT